MYCKSIQLLLLAVVPLLVHGTVCGGQAVQGILVSGKARHPVAGARLQLVDDSGHIAARDVTDSASGAFALAALGRGHYEVKIVVGRGGVSFSPRFELDSAEVVERVFSVPDWPRAVLDAYLAEDVSKQAVIKQFPRGPKYPDGMRERNQGGIVRARFVVDRGGKPDMSTFMVVESEGDSFAESVRRHVGSLRFEAAQLNDSPVPQVVDLAFDFGIDDAPTRREVQQYGSNLIVIRATGVRR